MSTKIENAQITSVSLSMNDYGCLSFWIMLKGKGWGCGVGRYKIASGYLGANPEDFVAETGDGLVAMMRIMDTVGVDKWEDLKGKYIRCELKGLGEGIDKIGNLIEDRWFDVRAFFKEVTDKAKVRAKDSAR